MFPQAALLLAFVGVVLAAVSWFRARGAEARAGRAEKLATRADKRARAAEARALAAEQRAEAAHTLLMKQQASPDERHAAELDARVIADRWYAASRSVAAKQSGQGKAPVVPVTFDLSSLADRLAVDLLRAQVGRGDIERVHHRSDLVVVYVSTPRTRNKAASRRSR